MQVKFVKKYPREIRIKFGSETDFDKLEKSFRLGDLSYDEYIKKKKMLDTREKLINWGYVPTYSLGG